MGGDETGSDLVQEGEGGNDGQSCDGINQQLPPARWCLQSLNLLICPIKASLGNALSLR